MAKFSKKVMGKEVGSADVYAAPHTARGKDLAEADYGNGHVKMPSRANSMNVSVGNINRNGYDPTPESEGIETRGNGAATKGRIARGPMA